MKQVGRPPRKDKDNRSAASAEKGTKPGEIRKTYIVKTGDHEKICALAFYERKLVKDIIGEAIDGLMKKYDHEKLQILMQFHEASKK